MCICHIDGHEFDTLKGKTLIVRDRIAEIRSHSQNLLRLSTVPASLPILTYSFNLPIGPRNPFHIGPAIVVGDSSHHKQQIRKPV